MFPGPGNVYNKHTPVTQGLLIFKLTETKIKEKEMLTDILQRYLSFTFTQTFCFLFYTAEGSIWVHCDCGAVCFCHKAGAMNLKLICLNVFHVDYFVFYRFHHFSRQVMVSWMLRKKYLRLETIYIVPKL